MLFLRKALLIFLPHKIIQFAHLLKSSPLCYALYTAGFLLNKSKKEGIYKLGRKLNNKGQLLLCKISCQR